MHRHSCTDGAGEAISTIGLRISPAVATVGNILNWQTTRGAMVKWLISRKNRRGGGATPESSGPAEGHGGSRPCPTVMSGTRSEPASPQTLRRHPPDVVTAALAYHRMGFRVIPLRAADPSLSGTCVELQAAKLPTVFDYFTYSRMNRSAETVCRAFAGPSGKRNLGIITGRTSGIVVLDIDFKYGGKNWYEAQSLPPTLTVSTPFGLHLYFRHPGGYLPCSFQRLAPGVDLKGDGGWVCAPPSHNAYGLPYQWEADTVPLAPLPADVLEAIVRRSGTGWLLYSWRRFRLITRLTRWELACIPLHRRLKR